MSNINLFRIQDIKWPRKDAFYTYSITYMYQLITISIFLCICSNNKEFVDTTNVQKIIINQLEYTHCRRSIWSLLTMTTTIKCLEEGAKFWWWQIIKLDKGSNLEIVIFCTILRIRNLIKYFLLFLLGCSLKWPSNTLQVELSPIHTPHWSLEAVDPTM